MTASIGHGSARGVLRGLRGPTPALWLLIGVLAMLSAGITAGPLAGLAVTPATPHLPWLILVALMVVAETARVHLHFRGEAHTLTFAEVPLVLGLLFASPLEVVLAQLAGSLVARLIHRRQQFVKQAFNVVVAAFDACLAVLVFHAFTTHGGVSDPRVWAVAALATVVTTLASSSLVAAAISIKDRSLQLTLLAQTVLPASAVTVVNTAMALACAVVLHVSPAAAALLALPAAAVWVGYRASTQRADERERVDFLLTIGRVLHTPGPLGDRVAESVQLVCEQLRAERVEIVTLPGALPGLDGLGLHSADLNTEEICRLASTGEARLLRDRDVSSLNHGDGAPEAQAMLAPLRGGGGVIGGVLALSRLGEVSKFNSQDLQLLEGVAEQVTVTLERDALARSMQRLDDLRQRFEHQAHHDALTGLANRRRLDEKVELALEGPRDRGRGPALLLLDLDGFKTVNDSHGHAIGDELLMVVADRLRAALRPGDTAARVGGDEFVILLDDPVSVTVAQDIARRLLQHVSGPVEVGGHMLQVRASMGLAVAGPETTGPDELLQQADQVMYEVKRQGGGVGVYRADEQTGHAQLRSMRADLEQALAEGAIQPVFQAIHSMETGQLIAVETLARWHHAERGSIPAADFVELAEETGLIVPLGRHMLREACRQLAVWQRAYPQTAPSVTVNVSARELLSEDFADGVEDILADTGADATRLILEITETQVLGDSPLITAGLHRLRRLGIRVAIDDFGSGYASVKHLRRLPVDVLKVDRSLTQGAANMQADQEIVRAIVALASALRLQVIAEGVETTEEHLMLRELGCPLAQGYLLGHPGPAGAIDELLLSALAQPVEPRWFGPQAVPVN